MKKNISFLIVFLFLVLQNYSQNYCTLVTFSDLSHAYIDENGHYLYRESKDLKLKENIFPYKCGLGRIRREGKFGYINCKGEVLIPIAFEKAEDFSEGLAAIREDGKWGYIDTKGKIAIEPQFDIAKNFSEGMAIIGKNGKYGYIDKTGKIIAEPIFDRVCYFKNNRAWVLQNGAWACIDKKGEFIIQPYYSDTYDFSEGYAWVKKDLIWGLIDSTNKYLIQPNERNPLIYAHSANVKNFSFLSHGKLISKVNNKTGYCDLTLKKIIPAIFDDALEFENGHATVYIDGKCGIIDESGKFVMDPIYKEIRYLGHNLFAVKEKVNGWYVLSKDKVEISRAVYTNIYNFEPINGQKP
jgi:hypothetical protein